VIKRLKITLPYDPVIPLLGIHLNAYISVYNRDTCTSIFTAVVVIVAKEWNQPRYTPTDK
jgi:hypothetical protein